MTRRVLLTDEPTSARRIPLLDPETAPSPVKETFAAVKAKFGMVPNLFRVLPASVLARHVRERVLDRRFPGRLC